MQFDIDKKAMDKFEVFMTKTMERELKSAYARTLRNLSSGAARKLTKYFSTQEWAKDQIKEGIEASPKKVESIRRLDPMRAYVGVNMKRGRKKKVLESPISKPFIRYKLDNPYTGERRGKFLLQRYGKTEIPTAYKVLTATGRVSKKKRQRLHVMVAGSSETSFGNKMKFGIMFKREVERYYEQNHDKVFDRQFAKAKEKAGQ